MNYLLRSNPILFGLSQFGNGDEVAANHLAPDETLRDMLKISDIRPNSRFAKKWRTDDGDWTPLAKDQGLARTGRVELASRGLAEGKTK